MKLMKNFLDGQTLVNLSSLMTIFNPKENLVLIVIDKINGINGRFILVNQLKHIRYCQRFHYFVWRCWTLQKPHCSGCQYGIGGQLRDYETFKDNHKLELPLGERFQKNCFKKILQYSKNPKMSNRNGYITNVQELLEYLETFL